MTVAVALAIATLAAACSEVPAEELEARYDEVADGGATRLPATPDAAVDDVPCPFPTDGLGTVTCGEVVVDPGTGEVDEVIVAYAHFESFAGAGAAADPVVYLHGGPGGDIVETADLIAYAVVDPFIRERNVIVYDQRGAGLSSPLPRCTEAARLEDEFFTDATPHTALADDYVTILRDCGVELGADPSLDLTAYDSATHADDLVTLLDALGLGSVNLYGSSYGSRLAQTVLRDHPERVRSVIMSGVYPIEENLLGATPGTFRDALDAVFAACGADPECSTALPDPWAALTAVVAQLDATPVEMGVPINDRKQLTVRVAGDDLVNALHAALYRRDSAAMIPDLLIDLGDGDTSRLERLAADSLTDLADVGGYVTVQCAEEAPFTDGAEIAAAATGDDVVDRIDLPPGLIGADLLEVCSGWPVGEPDPVENTPVTWTQPTLLFSGGFDPITPPHWAAAMAERLPDAVLVHSNDLGHDSDESLCAQRIMADFVAEPSIAPDLGCTTPDTLPTIDVNAVRWRPETEWTLTPDRVDLGTGGAVEVQSPDWFDVPLDAGRRWWRDLDTLDLTSLTIVPGPASPDVVTDSFDVQGARGDLEVGGDAPPGWTRAEFRTAGMDAVLFERTGSSPVTVALAAYDDELDALVANVLEPVVASLSGG